MIPTSWGLLAYSQYLVNDSAFFSLWKVMLAKGKQLFKVILLPLTTLHPPGANRTRG